MVSWAHRNAVLGGNLDNMFSNALVLTVLLDTATHENRKIQTVKT